jgi:hypothetical protein
MHRRASTPLAPLALLALLAACSLLATSCSDDGTAAPASGGNEPAATVPTAGASIVGRADSPTPRPDGDPARPLAVALLTPAGPGALAAAATDGVRAASAEDGHVSLAEIAGPATDEVPTVVQKLCDDRYDLVVGVGSELVEPLTAVAAHCPTTSFLTSGPASDASAPTANVATWSPSAADIGYPLGLLAGAALAPGARIAVVGAADPAAAPIVDAFARGLAERNPTASTAPLDDDAVPAAALLGAALVFCPVGCDAATAGAGVPLLSGLAPASAPATALATTDLDLTSLYRDAFHLVRQQRFGGLAFTSTVEDGGVVVRVDASAAGIAVPGAELVRIADDLTARLRSGAVKLPTA